MLGWSTLGFSSRVWRQSTTRVWEVDNGASRAPNILADIAPYLLG